MIKRPDRGGAVLRIGALVMLVGAACTAAPTPPAPSCAPVTFDPTEFLARCTAGTVAPVQILDSARTVDVAFDGLQLAALEYPGALHHYDAEGVELGAIPVTASQLIEADCGFALRAYDGSADAGFFPVLRRFDRDLVEFGAGGRLADGWFLADVGNGDGFASFGSGAAGPGLHDTNLLGANGQLTSSTHGEYVGDVSAAIWDGSQYVVVGLTGGPGSILTALDARGHLLWSRGSELGGTGSIFPSAAGFFVWGAGASGRLAVAPHSHTGEALGPPVDLGAALGIPSPSLFAFGSHGDDVLVVWTAPQSDGSTGLESAHLDPMGQPVASPRELLHSPTLPLHQLKVIWAGYSYIVAFGGGSAPADPRVFILRVCP